MASGRGGGQRRGRNPSPGRILKLRIRELGHLESWQGRHGTSTPRVGQGYSFLNSLLLQHQKMPQLLAHCRAKRTIKRRGRWVRVLHGSGGTACGVASAPAAGRRPQAVPHPGPWSHGDGSGLQPRDSLCFFFWSFFSVCAFTLRENPHRDFLGGVTQYIVL